MNLFSSPVADMTVKMALATFVRVALQAVFTAWGASIVITDAHFNNLIVPVVGWLVVFAFQARQWGPKAALETAAKVPETVIVTKPDVAEVVDAVNVIGNTVAKVIKRN